MTEKQKEILLEMALLGLNVKRPKPLGWGIVIHLSSLYLKPLSDDADEAGLTPNGLNDEELDRLLKEITYRF